MKNRNTGTFDSVFRQKPPKRDLKLLAAGEKITLVEICVFLPEWLKHGDISKRFWFDGLDRNHIVNIMNWHGGLARDEGVTPNLITNWMNKSMRKLTGNKKWTHKSYAAELDRSNWDPTDLSLGNCKLNLEHEQRKGRGARSVIDRVPFGSLGNHVEKMPQGVDGLDLTRYVQYAKDHPKEELWFPQDFGYLAQKLGTVCVEKGHLGAEIAKRWTDNVAKDQDSQAAQMASHTDALQSLAFGQTVAEGSHMCEGESFKQNISVPAAQLPQDVAHPPYDAFHTPCDALNTPYGAFNPSSDALYPSSSDVLYSPSNGVSNSPFDDALYPALGDARLSHNVAHPFEDAVDHLQDEADTTYPILAPLAAPSPQQLVPEIAMAEYNPQDSYQEDFITGGEDESNLALHEDLLNLCTSTAHIEESKFAGDSLATAEILGLRPCLDDEALIVLYNRFQHLLYMAVPQHVNPNIFEKQW